MAYTQGNISKIDFSGIDPAEASGGDEAQWAAVRSAVMEALRTHGCFEAITDGLISPELRATVLGPGGALETLHSLPASTKQRCTNQMPSRGYLGSDPELAIESLIIMEPLSLDSVRAFADLMWPDTGNAAFCETMHAYVEKAEALQSVVRWMVLESVGATAEYIENLAKETSFKIRLTAYPAPGTAAEAKMGFPAHRDTSYLTVLTHNDIDGLELEDRRGEGGGWVRPALSPGSIVVFAGEMLGVLTNGQVSSPLHRVVVAGDKTRYSTAFFASPKDDLIVEAVDKTVDADHPAIYKPFEYGEYYVFAYKPEHRQIPCKVDAFALVRAD